MIISKTALKGYALRHVALPNGEAVFALVKGTDVIRLKGVASWGEAHSAARVELKRNPIFA